MKKSLTRIRTSHVGRLPPPKGWEDMPARLANAEVTDPAAIAAQVTPAIAETVRKQVDAGEMRRVMREAAGGPKFAIADAIDPGLDLFPHRLGYSGCHLCCD